MNIFKMDFKMNFKSVLIWSLISAAIMCVFMLLYPSMKNNDVLELALAKLNALPREIVEAFHMAQVDFTNIIEFFGLGMGFLLTATSIFGAVLGIAALAKEEIEGTIEFLYAKPVRRTQIFTAKLASAVVSYIVYTAVFGIVSIAVSVIVRPPDVDTLAMISTLKSVILGGMFAGLTYLFMGVLVSVFLKKGAHTAMLAVGIFFITSILGGLPEVLGILDFLRFISPIAYFEPREIIQSGINAVNVLICLGVMVACTAGASVVYKQKDFAV